jgi:hypothetical protein
MFGARGDVVGIGGDLRTAPDPRNVEGRKQSAPGLPSQNPAGGPPTALRLSPPLRPLSLAYCQDDQPRR